MSITDERADATSARRAAPTDAERRAALRGMKRLAAGLLVVAAIVFAVAFALQDQVPWLGFVRAAAEGAMVGAIADWFAVTALFRHPLGVKIPHTAIIPTRKDEIGATLGEFVRDEFLSEEIVRGKLGTSRMSQRVGEWLREPENAERVVAEASVAGRGILRLLADDDVTDLIERLAREQVLATQWAPAIGRVGEQLVDADQQRAAVDLLIEGAEQWVREHPEAFGGIVSERLPRWVPDIVEQLVEDRAHREVVGLLQAVRDDPRHPLRLTIDRYLADLTNDLQHDPAMIARVEQVKVDLVESPRMREFATELWTAVRRTLEDALEDPSSELRANARNALVEIGARLATDAALAAKVDSWVTDAAAYTVVRSRDEIAGVITETVARWDAREATDKIELQVGRDLQFIRINGTVVGALAGLAIHTIATLVGALL